jgi:two-component system chemotaxis response regulator CheB
LADGAADYLTKPTTTMQGGTDFKIELVAKVKALAASRRRIAGIPRPQPQPQAAASPAPAAHPAPSPTQGGSASATPSSSFHTPSANAPAPRSTGFTSDAGASGRVASPADRHVAERAPPPLARGSLMRGGAASAGSHAPRAPITLRQHSGEVPEIIAIGSSTGGPQALFTLVTALGRNLSQPIVITQHMPATFTTILAEHIERASGIPTVEGADGMTLQGGRAYVAPGDFHMTIEGGSGQRVLRILKTPQENFCRPSVDPMLRSLVKAYGRRVLVIMLTGMGHDGLRGSEAVVAAGGNVVAQDEATSVVWGMPGAVATAGLCSAVLPLPEIASHVRRLMGKAV